MPSPRFGTGIALLLTPEATRSFRQGQTSREAGTQSHGSGMGPDSRAAEERGDLGVVRKADASLFGWSRVGNPLCPSSQLITNLALQACSVTADGIDNISLWTGKGVVDGTFAVVVQDDNVVDAPEYVVMNGGFSGQMDLSIRPLGKITGTFTSAGSSTPVPFCGTFRLPFQVAADGKRQNPLRGQAAYYLHDDGATLIPVQAAEKSIGMPTVRLEVR